jgi:hypothetical protein
VLASGVEEGDGMSFFACERYINNINNYINIAEVFA